MIRGLVACLVAAFVVCPLGAQVPRLYRDRISPHWFAQNTRFWYENRLPQETHEFVVVDLVAGRRRPAFDHQAVAQALATETSQEVSPAKLPLDRLDYSETTSDEEILLLSGTAGTFRWHAAKQSLHRVSPAEAERSHVELFLPAGRSRNSDVDTEFVITNRLEQRLRLTWIDSSREQHAYGEITPGETRRQHTFAGHCWQLETVDREPLASWRATRDILSLTVTAELLATVRRTGGPDERGGRDEGRRDDGADRPSGRQQLNGESEQKAADETHRLRSTDGQWELFVRDDNLWLSSVESSSEVPLTSDADATHTFRRDASRARLIGMKYDQADFPGDMPDAHWSADSRYVVAFQTKVVPERRVHYVESSPAEQLQPRLLSYPYLKAGDPIPLGRPRLFRVADRLEVSLDDALFCQPWEIEFLRWSDDGEKFYLLYNQRGHQCLRLLEVAAATGAVRAIVDEVSPTFIHYSSEGKFELRWLANRELLWASERSGWNHLYRYDLASGAVLNAVTSGEWNVRRIESIDEDSGVVFFYAVGVRGDQDPYHEHFCRVNRDGSEFRILTQGDGTHQIEWSPDRAAFVDRYSRVDLPPVLELRDASTGRLICSLEQADASEVVAARGSFPERFVAKGRDGVTDIWGILHRPRDFDPQRRYPVIENIYAGPHDHHVPKDFRASYRHQQQIADAGFVVVQIDGMGTAWRSKAFHDVCYRNLRDAGFPDRIAWIKAAAERYPFLDLARVGIYGGSAGGQNAMAALLWHGDFYRAAVADCGCHDNRMDKIWWNEQWLGLPDGDHYAANSNTEHADQMQGHLMLVVGELDRNVDPSSTTQVVGRLIKADKDFEFLLVVGSGHGACETPWAARRRIQFFQSHLPADATRE